jgi:hypothetical protein
MVVRNRDNGKRGEPTAEVSLLSSTCTKLYYNILLRHAFTFDTTRSYIQCSNWGDIIWFTSRCINQYQDIHQ